MSIERFNQMVKERGFHWAYAMYEPTPEEREAEAERWREIGRKAAKAVDDAFWKVLSRPKEKR